MFGGQSQALLAAGDRLVATHEHGARLRERESDHRERDAADPHRDRPGERRNRVTADEGDQHARPQR
ncbi:hypothetical protein, partial [Microbacterium aurum]